MHVSLVRHGVGVEEQQEKWIESLPSEGGDLICPGQCVGSISGQCRLQSE